MPQINAQELFDLAYANFPYPDGPTDARTICLEDWFTRCSFSRTEFYSIVNKAESQKSKDMDKQIQSAIDTYWDNL